MLQLLAPDAIMQEEDAGVRVPDIKEEDEAAQTVPFQEVPAIQFALTVIPEPDGEVGTSDLPLL
jgi:hypothetical protein